ncbi:O-antigen polymerase [Phocaeicola plebeius]|uniref:O-antigen polymerase n=1 Tax=Phocaeicola plebeius TaxID=310297 RepID=UPI003566D630
MIAVPFIFFSFLFLKYKKKTGLKSIPTLLTGVYMTISFFAILIDRMNLYNSICPYVDIKIESAFLFCGLLYITILPFLKANDNKISKILPCTTTKWIDLLVYFYFYSLIIIILLTYQDLLRNIFLLGANENLKADFRFGREEVVHLNGVPLMIYQRLRFFSSSSLMLLFIFFYALAFWKKKTRYYILIFIGSLGCIYDAALHIDRSAIIYWMMFFVLCVCFFYRFLQEKQKKTIKVIGIITLGLILCYIIYINIARFSNLDISAEEYIISYLGQSYINFSLFIQELNLPSYTTIHVFPFTNHLVDPEFIGTDWYMYVQNKTGIFIMCFSTFIGEFISNMGLINTIIWCIAFSFICFRLLKRKQINEISSSQLFLLFALVCMPYLGIMASYYHVYAREIGALLFYFVFRISEHKKI